MTVLPMPGLASAKSLGRDSCLALIDRLALPDYRTGTPLSGLWSGACQTLVCDCTDSDPQVRPGAYLLAQMPEVLLEGILIAHEVLPEARIVLLISGDDPIPVCMKTGQFGVERSGTVPAGTTTGRTVLCCAETFVALARFFRREGADKRLCYVSGGGKLSGFLTVPLTSSVRDIAMLAGAEDSSAARLGGSGGTLLTPAQFGVSPPFSPVPSIQFVRP